MKNQHSDMFVYGEKGSTFSVESMRVTATQRLERYGWTSTIHFHTHDDFCPLPKGDCEQYMPEETIKPSEPDKDYS